MIEEFARIWGLIWGFLGPSILAIFILYLFYPEKFERVGIHALKLLSLISKSAERRSISKEVAYIISTSFATYLRLEEIPKIVVKWGNVDDAILDLKRNLLIIVLREDRRHHYENVARALLKATPDLLAPEMKVVYDSKLVDCLSAHITRNAVKENPAIVTYINEFISSEMEKDKELRELLSMLIEIDDQSLFSRLLLPELIRIAKLRYPHRDPEIDSEARELIRMVYTVVKGELIPGFKPVVCGKYFKLLIIRIARPEKIAEMLEPHIQFTRHALKDCPNMESIYVLAAGKGNILAAKYFKMLLMSELKEMELDIRVSLEDEYKGPYKGRPLVNLYVCKLEVGRQV
jgi:hypothetical protein